jgi:hypothetical protein
MFGLCVASVAEEDKADPDLNRIRVLRFFFHKLREQIFIADELWETKEDPLLSFSYHLLHDRQATPKQIAEFASRKLGRTVSTDTWLQRVRRWAERKKDRPIGLRKREKTSKSKGDVSK